MSHRHNEDGRPTKRCRTSRRMWVRSCACPALRLSPNRSSTSRSTNPPQGSVSDDSRLSATAGYKGDTRWASAVFGYAIGQTTRNAANGPFSLGSSRGWVGGCRRVQMLRIALSRRGGGIAVRPDAIRFQKVGVIGQLLFDLQCQVDYVSTSPDPSSVTGERKPTISRPPTNSPSTQSCG